MKTALVIDDNIAVAETLEIFLDLCNITSVIFTDSYKSIEDYKKNSHKYDVVCLDYYMPHINGLDLFHIFYKINSNIKAFIHTGGDIPTIEKNIKGLYGFIIKPYNVDNLKQMLKKMEE